MMFVFTLAIVLTILLTNTNCAMKKEKKKTVKVMVLADFAGLKRKQLSSVVSAVQKKYPETVILPHLYGTEENEFNDDKVNYRYYLCTIEHALFGGVSVKYFDTKNKKNIEVASVAL